MRAGLATPLGAPCSKNRRAELTCRAFWHMPIDLNIQHPPTNEMINAWAPRVNTNIHLATLLCSTSGTDGMLMWPTPPCAAHALHPSCTVPVRAPPPLQGLGAPSSTGCAGLCVRFGWRRGGGQWADHPGPHSGPKVWATRGVPHYGVHPLLSTLVGPFFDPGMPAHGVPSLGGGVSRFNLVHRGAPELMHS